MVLGASTTLGIASCGSKKPTAIVLAVSTEGRVPVDVDQLEIHVVRSGSDSFVESYTLPADAPIPGTLTVQSRDASDSSPIAVTVTAKSTKKGTFTILRTARLGFQEEHTKLLRLPLRYSCVDFPCADGQSCLGGACVDASVEVSTLPEFQPSIPVFVSKGQGACFDKDACLAGAKPLVVTGDATACSFAVPSGDYNVFMSWASAPDNPVVVEQDQAEGYVARGSTATLAPGLCGALFGAGKTPPRAAGISVATTCKTKAPDDSICVTTPSSGMDAGLDAAKDAQGGDGSTAEAGVDGGIKDASADAPVGDAGGPLMPTAPDSSGATIPAGSYPPGTVFTVTDFVPLGATLPASVPAIPSQFQQAGDVYLFQPDNTVFSAPVKVHVHYSVPLANLTLLTAEPGAGVWSMVAQPMVNGAFVDATVSHFSYFVVVGAPSPIDASVDAPADASDDAEGGSTAPECAPEKCSQVPGMDGGTYVQHCDGSCTGLAAFSCNCASADPSSCFCASGKSAPSCAAGSLSDCGYPVTCNASFSTDTKNCGYCGHDCGTQACKNGVCVVDTLTLGANNLAAADWATDGASIYFTAVFPPGVYSVPLGGAAAETPIATNQSSPYGLAIDAANVYWRNADGKVYSVSKKGGTPNQIGAGATWFSGPSTYHTLAVDSTSVYWAVQPSSGLGIVYATDIGGTGQTITLASDSNVQGSIGVDATNVYYTGRDANNDGSVLMVPKTGGKSVVLATFKGDQHHDLVIGPDGVYVNGFAQLYKLDFGAPSTPVVVWDPTVVGGLASVDNVAFDATYVWWTDFVGGRLWARPLAGGLPRVFTSGLFEPSLILLEPNHVAWESAGGAGRMPKSVFP